MTVSLQFDVIMARRDLRVIGLNLLRDLRNQSIQRQVSNTNRQTRSWHTLNSYI